VRKTKDSIKAQDLMKRIDKKIGTNAWPLTMYVPRLVAFSPLTISSGQAIAVRPGCHIQTMDHIITADDSSDMEIHSTWLDWMMTLSQLFDHTESEQIN
jgi:hypothetical protein